jgi:high frequency lysogenization protein
VLALDREDPEEALGGIEGVYLGLSELTRSHPDPAAIERLRYTISLIQLQRNLRKDSNMAGQIHSALLTLRDDPELTDPASEQGIAALSEIYVSTLSHLPPKIMVRGEQRYLETDRIPMQVRAALLAGVRAAYLFHELGGRRIQLFIHRNALVEAAARLQQAQHGE